MTWDELKDLRWGPADQFPGPGLDVKPDRPLRPIAEPADTTAPRPRGPALILDHDGGERR